MPTLFLDTHIWNYLVEKPEYTAEQLQQARERLIDGVKQGNWAIVSSLPVLQEVLAVYRQQPEKYKAIKALLFDAVTHRWLIELKDRYVAELHNGGLLLPTSRYLDREKRRKIKRLVDNKKDVVDVNEATYQEAQDFKAQQEDAKTKIFTDLGSTDGKPPKKIAQAYEKWFKNDRDLEGWVLKVLEGGVSRGLFTASKLQRFRLTSANVPSAWQYVDFRQAKILQNLGKQIAIKDSDAVDADTYGCNPYYDILVTDDKIFKEAIDLVIAGKFEVYGFKQLMHLLKIV